MRTYWRALINLFYPKSCVGCGVSLLREEDFLCISCEIDLPLNPQLLEHDNEIKTVFAGRLPLVTANTFLYFSKNGITQHLMHQLKYKDRQDVGSFLGQRFAEELKLFYTLPVDIVIPMPLHPDKEKLRGYNQCSSIARGMADVLHCEVREDVIIRSTANPSQTKLNRAKRWDNVKGIFELVNAEAIANKHVLLIDDTLTTGATLESCGSELVAGKNTQLSIATLAYAK
jgi:ComF family protein